MRSIALLQTRRVASFLATLACLSMAWKAICAHADKALDYLEMEAGWMATTLDARSMEGAEVEDNLTVRGLVFRLGEGAYGCFDTELLRWSVVWHGDFLSYRSMATQSYFQPGVKNVGGQTALCEPLGKPLSVTGLYPGIFSGEPRLHDPRDRGLDPRNLGRGPLSRDQGVWKAVGSSAGGNWLSYQIGSTSLREVGEMQVADGKVDWVRSLEVGPHSETLYLVMASVPQNQFEQEVLNPAAGRWSSSTPGQPIVHAWVRSDTAKATLHWDAEHEVLMARIAPTELTSRLRLFVGHHRRAMEAPLMTLAGIPSSEPAVNRWPDRISTTWKPVSEQAGMIQENLPLPDPNPWQRKVRSSAMAFDNRGWMWVTTFDGDLWLAQPMDEASRGMQWRRVAAGLHEPMSVCLKEGEPYIYTRNGIICLKDRDGDGDYEEQENFCNRFTQTAETREFAMAMVLADDGNFYLAKSGQQLTYQGVDNGKILRVSSDGAQVETIATGLRQPYVGYIPQWDLLMASDQQGHWVPSTPVHWIRHGHHYGFRPSAEVVPPSQPITEPLCWIPHRVVQSGADSIWLGPQGMGDLNDTMVYLDYYRPRLVAVHPDTMPNPHQAAVVPLPFTFDVPLLKAVQHPANDWLHLVGFRIWGSNARQWAGLVRLRPSGDPAPYPTQVRGFEEGIWLRFAQPLDEAIATQSAQYAVQQWDYRRSSGYGSGYYREDGQSGTERVPVLAALLSPDRQGVFLVTPKNRQVMQMEVVYRLASAGGEPLEGSAYLTLNRLPQADWSSMQLEKPAVSQVAAAGLIPDLPSEGPASSEHGQQLYETMGCMACHSMDGSTSGRVGPTFAGLWGRSRSFVRGEDAAADEAYLRESILEPSRKVLRDYADSDIGMPSYQGVLSEWQVQSLIEWIKSLE